MSENLRQEVHEMVDLIIEEINELLYQRFYKVAAERDTYFKHLALIAEEYERDGVLSEATKNVLNYIRLLEKANEESDLRTSEAMKEAYK